MSHNHNHYNKNPLEFVATDIFDLITVNGRISKKLVEKVIIPEIDRYYESLKEINKLKKSLEIANEALVKIDSSNDDMKYFNSEIDSILKEAQKQIQEIMESK